MLYTFIVNPEDLRVDLTGDVSKHVPLAFSANPYNNKGMPVGIVAQNGELYTTLPDKLPVLVFYSTGGAEIRKEASLDTIMGASSVVSGSALLIDDYEVLEIQRDVIDVHPTREMMRVGVGALPNGALVVAVIEGTVEQLQDVFVYLKAQDAIMLSYGNVYLNYAHGGTRIMSDNIQPIVTVQASRVKELLRPLVVLDAGHGGVDLGVVAFGVKEKDFTLRGVQYIKEYLDALYECTVILTRDCDATVSLAERTRAAVNLNADLFVSFHVNAGRSTGFETYCHPSATPLTQKVRHTIHDYAVSYLAPKGIADLGEKYFNTQVLRDTTTKGVRSIRLGSLFLDNPTDLAVLQDKELFRGLCHAIAEGVAKSLGMYKKGASKSTYEGPKTLYKVQVDSFQFRKGAEELVERLRNAGFSAFIIEDRGGT